MFTNINIIFKKELKSYFNSPMAYIFLVVFAIVTLALTNDSSSIIKLLPPTDASLTTPLATELYLVPPLLTDTTSIAPDTELPVTFVSITSGQVLTDAICFTDISNAKTIESRARDKFEDMPETKIVNVALLYNRIDKQNELSNL